jgi:hypothetical protein
MEEKKKIRGCGTVKARATSINGCGFDSRQSRKLP